MLDYFFNSEEADLEKNEKKKKLHALLDKYGSVEEIEKNAVGADGYAYMFANTDDLIDEVLAERRLGRPSTSQAREDTLRQKEKLLPDDEDFSLEGLTLTDRQRAALNRLDMHNQLAMIRILREQQGVAKPAARHEEAKAASQERDAVKTTLDVQNPYAEEARQKLYASNEHAGVKSDAEVEHNVATDDEPEDINIKDNIFNQNNFIHQTMRPIIENNEGVYSYPYLDTRGKTTIGVGANINNAELNEDWYYKDPKMKKLRHLDKNNPEDLALIQSELKKLQDVKDSLPLDENGKLKNNYKAKYFEKITNLRISDEHLNKLYYDRVKEAITDIQNTIKRYNKDPQKQRTIPDFEKLPQPLQIVMVDMMYNLGQPKFDYKENDESKGFPNFWDAIAKRNVAEMIKHSRRIGVQKERNDETQNILRRLYDVKY